MKIKDQSVKSMIPNLLRTYNLRWQVFHHDYYGNLRCHKICGYMAYTTFKMIIFNQFRHALTRHDPKTYLIWCEALSVTLGFDVPPPSPEDSSTPHFDLYFRIYFLHGSSSSWVHSEIYYLIIYPEKMSSIWFEFDRDW